MQDAPKRGTNCHNLQGLKYATNLTYVKSCSGAEKACVICVASRAGQRGGYKGAGWIHIWTGAFSSSEPVSNGRGFLEENEPANNNEEPHRGDTGLETLDWETSEICPNFRTLGF